MTEQAAKLTAECPQCQKRIEGWAVQMIRNQRLHWEVEWACDTCGNWHDGDWGIAPDYVRDALLKDHGFYRARVTAANPAKGKVLKAFRDALGASLSDAKNWAQEAVGEGFRGTYIEASLISKLLQMHGIESSVIPERP
ncbi:hypothetical protein ACWD4G_33565 [Streptomyces sp. NPDC002643]